MAFYTGCGNDLAETAKFCPRCGTAAAGAASGAATGASTGASTGAWGQAPPSYSYAPEPLDYKIEGDNLQIARVKLKPGQEIYAEAGRMIYKTPNVYWETRMSGESLGEKILGAIKRKITPSSAKTGFAARPPSFSPTDC